MPSLVCKERDSFHTSYTVCFVGLATYACKDFVVKGMDKTNLRSWKCIGHVFPQGLSEKSAAQGGGQVPGHGFLLLCAAMVFQRQDNWVR